MLSKKVWVRLKKKLSELPPEIRIRELKVLLAQSTEKDITKEIKELIEKSIVEIQVMGARRDATGEISIGSRLRFIEEERPVSGELEDIVGTVPIIRGKEDGPGVKYEAGGEYEGKGYLSESYFSKSYERPGGERSSEETERGESVESIKKSLGFDKDYT